MRVPKDPSRDGDPTYLVALIEDVTVRGQVGRPLCQVLQLLLAVLELPLHPPRHERIILETERTTLVGKMSHLG